MRPPPDRGRIRLPSAGRPDLVMARHWRQRPAPRQLVAAQWPCPAAPRPECRRGRGSALPVQPGRRARRLAGRASACRPGQTPAWPGRHLPPWVRHWPQRGQLWGQPSAIHPVSVPAHDRQPPSRRARWLAQPGRHPFGAQCPTRPASACRRGQTPVLPVRQPVAQACRSLAHPAWAIQR